MPPPAGLIRLIKDVQNHIIYFFGQLFSADKDILLIKIAERDQKFGAGGGRGYKRAYVVRLYSPQTKRKIYEELGRKIIFLAIAYILSL